MSFLCKFTFSVPKKSLFLVQHGKKCYSSLSDELKGTVGYHRLHLGFLTSEPSWPVKFFSTSPFHLEFFSQLRNFSPELFSSVKLTNIYSSNLKLSETNQDRQKIKDTDVVLFPLGIKFSGIQKDLGSFFEFLQEHIKNDFSAQDALNWINKSNKLEASFIESKNQFVVCTHNEVDCRCGSLGGNIYESLKKMDSSLGFSSFRCSHIGGHKYAGNVIVYPQGDWYGHIDKDNLSTLIEHVNNDKIWRDHWRGRIGLKKEAQLSYFSDKRKDT